MLRSAMHFPYVAAYLLRSQLHSLLNYRKPWGWCRLVNQILEDILCMPINYKIITLANGNCEIGT